MAADAVSKKLRKAGRSDGSDKITEPRAQNSAPFVGGAIGAALSNSFSEIFGTSPKVKEEK